MSDTHRASAGLKSGRSLLSAIRDVRTAEADRADVVVDLRDADRMRLDLLVQELEPVLKEVGEDDTRFDFVVSSGLQPRFWIDAVSHVAMGRDRRSYRFVRDTRIGRVVLIETSDIKAAADHVTRYIAERVVERQRALEGDAVPVLPSRLEQVLQATKRDMPRDWAVLLGGLGLIGAGIVVGLLAGATIAWLSGVPFTAL